MKPIYVMYFATILTMSVLYAVQPLQPLFMQNLNITQLQASFFTTSILIPLAFASILYGYILEKFPIKDILFFAFIALGIFEIIFGLASSYVALITIRAIQGLIAPAALTGIVSYISMSSQPSEIAVNIGRYVGITVVGGFVGRMLSGSFADIFGWRVFFFVLGISLLISAYFIRDLKSSGRANFAKPTLKDIKIVFSIKHNFFICAMIFLLFFAFQAVLNFLPFRISQIDGVYSGTKIGTVYFGYALGVLVSFNARKILSAFASPFIPIIIGILIFLISLQFLRASEILVIFIAMVFICLGNFIAHSLANATINTKAGEHKGIVNGCYISSYYAGGALGSFAFGKVYLLFGWGVFVSTLSIMLILATILMVFLYKNE
ncbi:MAG: MFS transporter [Campylobacter sp.]|nr:MFS transporter [Campylobacter sp.]